MDDREKVKFRRKIGSRGGSLGITIPQELLEYIEINDGDDLTLTAEVGKHGKFLALFKE